MKAMLLAAGLGSRLKPFTDNHPKALAVVNGKTLLQRNIEYLASFGFNDVIVNVHHFANQIIETLNTNNNFGSNVTISDETEEVLETGGGLKKASWFFGQDDFVLMNVDMLTTLNLKDLLSNHLQNKPLATLATTNRATSRYFLTDDNNNLVGWRNVKTNEEIIVKDSVNYHQQAFSGIHIINPALLKLIPFTGKFSMVNVYLELAKQNTIKTYNHSNDLLIDVGRPESVIEAEQHFK